MLRCSLSEEGLRYREDSIPMANHGVIKNKVESKPLLQNNKPTKQTMKIVIIGGVAGGASAAARARRLDESAEIVMLQAGPDVSFASCGMVRRFDASELVQCFTQYSAW